MGAWTLFEARATTRMRHTQILVLLALLLQGCKGVGPELSIDRAQRAGNFVLVEVKTATIEAGFEGSPSEYDPRYYLLTFEQGQRRRSSLVPKSVQQIGWENSVPAATSENRILRMQDASSSGGRWSAEILEVAEDGKGWNALRSWTWDSQQPPQVAASTDGGYLVTFSPSFEVIDVRTLLPRTDETLAKMFDAARELKPDAQHSYTLTHNLNYLAVRIGADGILGKEVESLTGGQVRLPPISGDHRDVPYVLVLSRRMGGIAAAVPVRFFDLKPVLVSWGLQGIDESASGDLRLLYSRNTEGSQSLEYIIFDENFQAIHRTKIAQNSARIEHDISTGPNASWDAANHRVLFYRSSTYFPELHNGSTSVRCWDYETNTFSDMTLDVAVAFTKGRLHYTPRQAFQAGGN